MKPRRPPTGPENSSASKRSPEDRAAYAEFGRRLHARMVEFGWNQTELSRRATANLPKVFEGQVQGHSIGRDRISSYIRGKYLPRSDGLAAIAKALKCDPEDLLVPKSAVPSASNSPALSVKSLNGQLVHIQLNQIVSTKGASAIMRILADEDGA